MSVSIKAGFRDLWGVIIRLSLMRLSSLEAVDHNAYTLITPLTINVQKGLCVYIPCTFTTDPKHKPTATAYGIWYRNKDVITSQDQSPENNKNRILFMGDASKGDCSLYINNAESSDGEGHYMFRLQDDSNSYSFQEYKKTVIVTDLTDKPVISLMENMVAGEKVMLTCTSPGKCNGSAPHITWNGIIQDEIPAFSFIEYVDGNISNKQYYSKITFTPMKDDNGKLLTCTVNFPTSSATTSQQITLNVEYPPVVSITSKGVQCENITVLEGESRNITCTVDSNPQANISWYNGDNALNARQEGQTLIYELKNAGPNDTGSYRCLANNRWLADRFINIIVESCTIDGNNSAVLVREGSSLSLRCSSKASPAASILWAEARNWTSQSAADFLNLSSLSLDDEGTYTCQAKNTHGQASTPINITVTYQPRTPLGRNSTCNKAEHHIECTCIVQSFPLANIQWKFHEKIHISSDKDIQISTSRSGSVTTSNLNLQLRHQSAIHIECISSNEIGNLILILFNEKEKPVYPMILAVTVVILVAVSLGTGFIILQYSRKKKLKQREEDKKEITEDSHDVIYSNSHMYSNDCQLSEENQVEVQKDGAVYMNCEDVKYASINFSKKPQPVGRVKETETEYAVIKRQ
ncbi:myelin-associated glycoprotein-like isoform X2 [Hyperolius riggenbachi]|uniref:myelin-associated glycoprotein-like isoform X2 n=1 Tax=Hyperolius riggenbachi TaxID=752182 RepID=UPI0035A3BA82